MFVYTVAIFSDIYSLKAHCDIWGTYIKWFLTFQTSRNESSSLFMSPLYILLHEVYCVSLFIVAWHLAVRRSGQSVHWEYLSHSKDSCCPFPLHCFLPTIPVHNYWGKGYYSLFLVLWLWFLFSIFLSAILNHSFTLLNEPILTVASAFMSNPFKLVTWHGKLSTLPFIQCENTFEFLTKCFWDYAWTKYWIFFP